jgi:hypothetical protein
MQTELIFSQADIPIIALSGNKGYKVAKTSQEIEIQIKEHQSRIVELKKQILYLKKHQSNLNHASI